MIAQLFSSSRWFAFRRGEAMAWRAEYRETIVKANAAQRERDRASGGEYVEVEATVTRSLDHSVA